MHCSHPTPALQRPLSCSTLSLFFRLAFATLSIVLLHAPSSALAGETNAVVAPYASHLVALEGKALVPLKPDTFLQAPYIVLYFSAKWCPDCRVFSPKLVEAYSQQRSTDKRFEVLLISRDKTEKGMLDYMAAEKMTWPALAFDKIAAAADLQRFYSGHGIPCLTVIDPKGTIVLQSESDQDAEEVLQELKKRVSRKN